MPYSLNDNLTLAQFDEVRSSGSINPAATYADYLALRREREERTLDAQLRGLTGDEPPELTSELEMLLWQARESTQQHSQREEVDELLYAQQTALAA